MAHPVKLSKLEYQLMEVLWEHGASAVREIQEALPRTRPLAYTTVQTTIARMEAKGVVERAGQSGTALLFRPCLTREQAQHSLIEDLLAMFGGSSQPVMAHLVETGKLSLEDVREAEKALRKRKKGAKE